MKSSWRITPLVAIGLAALLLGMGLLLVVYDEHAYRRQESTDAQAEARILAETVTAALSFDDRSAASEYVTALEGDGDVRAAAIYGADGKLFASYARNAASDQLPPLIAQISNLHLDSDHLLQGALVSQGSTVLGTAFVEIQIDPIARRLERYGIVGLMATMAALIVIVLGVAHGALRRANAELAARAGDLALANENLETQIRERRKAEEALVQSQKMEAIGRLTGGVAHDFNNLLTVVAGNLDLIQHMLSGPRALAMDRLQRLLEGAQRGVARGERLTRQLLAFSRQQPLQSRVVDINATIEDFAPFIRRALGETIELQLKLGPGPWLCRLDPAQFEAAILNLALNARDAMEQGGTLAVGTGVTAEAEDVLMPHGVLVTVTDTGTGMAPETLERIFEPFYTTKEVGKGSGLGLAQVWGFVTQSGGRVGVESALGRGTTFTLLLPLTDTAAPAASQVEAPSSLERGVERILVVEDDDDVRAMTAATLEELGYRTVIARDGPEALAALGKDQGIDLLFSDYVMPGMSGAELARAAQEKIPDLKVLLTSGYAKHAQLGDGNSADGFPLLPKPYRVDELAAKIRVILDQPVPGAD
ncbi:MAG TPA: ATP-binding protein [Stellaceae bacterium]|nr:ATP-binding protein [Stellaceae bacterium]